MEHWNNEKPSEGCEDTRHLLETDTNGEDFVPKDIISRRIRVTETFVQGIENLYDQEEPVETYEKWLKKDNERLDIEERERKIARRLTTEKVHNTVSDKFRKDDTLRKKPNMFKGFYSQLSIWVWTSFPVGT